MKKLIYLLLFALHLSVCKAQTMTDSAVKANLKQAAAYLKPNSPAFAPEKAYPIFKQCADAGNVKAFLALGWMYSKGVGVSANGQQALYWYNKAADKDEAIGWVSIGKLYKYGIDGRPDYEKAYTYFCKAADKNNPNGLFLKGYMLYTGLGCNQNYEAAYFLFQQSAKKGYPHAMRFLGLCMRNGYGTTVNADSAKYWMRMASKLGNGMSDDELESREPENADITGSLVNKIKAAQQLSQQKNPVNTYTKLQHSIPAKNIEGNYTGWLLKYDWSGQHVVQADKLIIKLIFDDGELKGTWTENDTLSIPLHARLTPKAIVFTDMQYAKHGHYYRNRREVLSFEKAGLQLLHNSDTTYLCGDLQMFSVLRNEPAKPMFVALQRTGNPYSNNTNSIDVVNEDGSQLVLKKFSAYPNPFTNIITLDFELKQSSQVNVTLQTIEGKVVFAHASEMLDAGNYTIPIQPQELTAGTYLLSMYCGKRVQTLKVVKL